MTGERGGMGKKKKKMQGAPQAAEVPVDRRGACRLRIRKLFVLSRRGLWGLGLFLLVSTGVVAGMRYMPPVPAGLRQVLGPSPPVNLISLALAVYAFSALVLILSRMMGGSGTYRGWSHLGYLSAFYLFYYYGNSLEESFWAVFAAGLTILGLEHYHIWTFASDAIRKEKEDLVQLERRDRFLSGEGP